MIAKTSYVSIEDANTFFEGRLEKQDWTYAINDDRLAALIQASTDIDKLNFEGYKLVDQQEHEFPRQYNDCSVVLDDDNIPLNIKYAVCLQALALLGGFDANKEIESLSLRRAEYGGVKTEFDRSVLPIHIRAGINAEAWQLICPFMRDDKAIALFRV